MILIVCLSIYPIRSIIFTCKVARARVNNNLHKMQKGGALLPSTDCKMASIYKPEIIANSLNHLEPVNRPSGEQIGEEYPFISLLVATHNESLVIDRLLNSFVTLSYPNNRFEIMIVDDSTDDTYQKIQSRLTDLQNLKVIRRENRAGWK